MKYIKKHIPSWVKRRWFELRHGHSVYLIFLLTFMNFVTIQYKLLLERVDIVNQYLSNMWIFAFVFIATYVPLAIIIGHIHFKKQYGTEAVVTTDENPYTFRIVPESKETIGLRVQLIGIDVQKNIVNSLINDKKTRDDSINKLEESRKIIEYMLSGGSSKNVNK